MVQTLVLLRESNIGMGASMGEALGSNPSTMKTNFEKRNPSVMQSFGSLSPFACFGIKEHLLSSQTHCQNCFSELFILMFPSLEPQTTCHIIMWLEGSNVEQ